MNRVDVLLHTYRYVFSMLRDWAYKFAHGVQADEAARLAMAGLFYKAAMGYPTPDGPYQYLVSEVRAWFKDWSVYLPSDWSGILDHGPLELSDYDRGELIEACRKIYCFTHLLDLDVEQCLAVADMVQATDPWIAKPQGPLGERGSADMLAELYVRWLSVENRDDEFNTEVNVMSYVYADGEHDRTLGSAHRMKADAEEATRERQSDQVHDRGHSDPQGTDDQVAGLGCHRASTPGEDPWAEDFTDHFGID